MVDSINNTMKTFWVMFFKDPATGVITGTVLPHNAKADYKDNPYFIGCKQVQVNLERLKK